MSTNKTFFGHPVQLASLFHIELWERFSFYGLQGIVMMYLYFEASKGGLGIDKSLAGGIIGAYGGSVYLSTILGAWLADRLWGAEKTLFISGIVVMCGHIALALIPGLSGLLVGLPLIALGSGGVKASASTMVGSLYEKPELRSLRDAGFSIFYISVNIGSFFGPLLTGLLQENIGFHYGFGAAAIGMAFGLSLYTLKRKALPATPAPNPLLSSEKKRAFTILIGGAALIIGAVYSNLLNVENFSTVLLSCEIIAILIYFFRFFSSKQVSAENKGYIVAYIPMFAAVALFVAIYMQLYTTATVYFEETVDRNLGGFVIPVSWKDSVQSLWVVLFSGLFALLWTKLGKRQPKTPLKFAMGLALLGCAFVVFVPYLTSGVAMPVLVFALVLLAITFGELLLAPIATSFVTKIAPPAFKTQMVALNFLAYAIGFTVGGLLFKNGYNAEAPANYYWLLFGLGVGAAVLLVLLVPALNKRLKGID